MAHDFLYTGDKSQVENNIRWCRQHFGPRGQRWDFTGNYRNITLWFGQDQDATWYALSWPARRLGRAYSA